MIMMYYLGSDGIAAVTIVLYAQFVLSAIFIGVSPLYAYNYKKYLYKLLKNSISIIIVSSIAMLVLCNVTSEIIARLFSNDNQI